MSIQWNKYVFILTILEFYNIIPMKDLLKIIQYHHYNSPLCYIKWMKTDGFDADKSDNKTLILG